MPASATNARPIHVHGAEISTDQAQLWDYAEVLAALIALVVFLATAWVVADPGPDAGLVVPAPIAPVTGTFEVADGEARTIVQPDPDGPAEVAVVRRGADFSQPIAPIAPESSDALGVAAAQAATAEPLA